MIGATRVVRCAAVASMCALAACPGRYIETHPGGVAVRSSQTGWYTKKVVTKKAPETLLADDATFCRVSPDRYANTDVGALVYCDWQRTVPR